MLMTVAVLDSRRSPGFLTVTTVFAILLDVMSELRNCLLSVLMTFADDLSLMWTIAARVLV